MVTFLCAKFQSALRIDLIRVADEIKNAVQRLWHDLMERSPRYFSVTGWKLGEEVWEDFSVLPPDDRRADQGRASWDSVTPLPPGVAGCRKDQVWELWDRRLRVLFTGQAVDFHRRIGQAWVRFKAFVADISAMCFFFSTELLFQFHNLTCFLPLSTLYDSHGKVLPTCLSGTS